MLPTKRKSLENDINPGPYKKSANGNLGLRFKQPAVPQSSASSSSSSAPSQCWMVQWRKPQYKKHKTWDGDGVLTVQGTAAILHDMDGHEISRGKANSGGFESGDEFAMGGKEIQLDAKIPIQDFLSGKCFGIVAMSQSTHAVDLVAVPLLQTSKTSGIFKPHTMASSSRAFKPPLSSHTPLAEKQPAPKEITVIDDDDDDEAFKDMDAESSFWTVNWRKQQTKKNKTWDGDGIVVLENTKLILYNEHRKLMGTGTWTGERLRSGLQVHIAGKDVELNDEMSEEDFNNAGAGTANVPIPSSRLEPLGTKFKLPIARPKPIVADTGIPAKNFYAIAAPKPGKPRHDPNAPDAIVMKEPSIEHQARFNKKKLPVVPVVLDPRIARHLRPHQVEGVKFMYESVMGLRKHEGNGCILADEMGLGKTLQTIALIWTLLKQNPYGNITPVAGKVMVVCPVSLIKNWRNEFNKWIGRDHIGVFVGDKDKAKIKLFVNSKRDQVLIIGYEKLRTVAADLTCCNPPIGLIICDEGHRLKSSNNKTTQMFDALRTKKRVILSGTPIQNDLGEFHAMTEFCNPGLLGDYKTFNRIFESPIVKSRAPNCTEKVKEVGNARSEELLEVSRSYVLRRTADILSNYLPPKHEYVVFVKPTALQLSIFDTILKPEVVDDIIHGSTVKSLALIQLLAKVCNSPILLKKKDDMPASAAKPVTLPSNVKAALALLPPDAQKGDSALSGKLTFLANYLRSLRQGNEEKCVLVSNYTATLDVIEALCHTEKYTYSRLDGSTKPDKRQGLVDEFNRSTQKARFLFLLSTKAGGVGLNLIGASRLILIDSDWNPAHDLQAMARIHRDGQKRPVFIYRLVTAGTIDEKIFQRQVTKMGLSDSLMGQDTSDQKEKSSTTDDFTPSQLKDIFTINTRTACYTHELLECDCLERQIASSPLVDDDMDLDDEANGDDSMSHLSDDDGPTGFVVAKDIDTEKLERKVTKKKRGGLASLQDWSHVHCLDGSPQEYVKDKLLHALLPAGNSSRASSSDDGSDVEAADGNGSGENGDTRLPSRGTHQADAHGLPGGTVTFIFERKTKTQL